MFFFSVQCVDLEGPICLQEGVKHVKPDNYSDGAMKNEIKIRRGDFRVFEYYERETGYLRLYFSRAKAAGVSTPSVSRARYR